MRLFKIHFRFITRLQKQRSCKILLIKHMDSSKSKLCKTTHPFRFGDVGGILIQTKEGQVNPYSLHRGQHIFKSCRTLISTYITVHTIGKTLLENNERFPFCAGDNCGQGACWGLQSLLEWRKNALFFQANC